MGIAVRPAARCAAGILLVALAFATAPARASESAPPAGQPPAAREAEPATAEDKELAWARGSGDAKDIGTALVAVARARIQEGEPQRATGALEEALDIANSTGDDSLARAAALSMADAYHALRDYDAAERWIERANTYRDRVPGRFTPREAVAAAERLAAQAANAKPDAAPSPDGAAAPADRDAPTPAPAVPLAARAADPASASPASADPLDPRALGEMVRRMRWLLLLLAGLMAALLWSTLRRGARLGVEADRMAREQRLLDTVNRTLRQETEKSRRAVREDALTGALTRDAFAHELERLLAHGARLSRPVVLMVIDLDHFKDINDRHGHLAGDAALRLAAGAMRAELEEGGPLGRYGGDEFLVACFDRTRAQALQLAERIRTAVRGRAAEDPAAATRGLTLSMGVALALPGRAHTVEALFQRADSALYAAKNAGRDRVVMADDDPAQKKGPE